MPGRLTHWTAAAVLAASLSAAPARAADKNGFAGTWAFALTRKGWDPEVAGGRLVLESAGGKWSGNLTFEKLLRAAKVKLADVSVRGTDIEFRLDITEFDIRLEGKLEKGSMAGSCTWKGSGRYPWTATRADVAPVARFEDGLSFDASLPKGDAEKQGMDGVALDALITEAAANDTDALVVLRDGKIVAERTFGRPAGPIHVMSITKFVTAYAVAMLIDDKKLSLDAPLSTWFPEWTDGLRAKVLLRHVLTHTSGIEHGMSNGRPDARKLNAEKDKVAYVRKLPVTAEPGTEWAYNNEATALLSGVLGKAAGRPVDEYLKDRLFAPLGVKTFKWQRDDAGNPFTYANLFLAARDLARIGQLAVDGGMCGTKRLVSAESLAALGTPATSASATQGLIWMLQRDEAGKDVVGWYHTGSLGQWIVVQPKTKTVAVRLRRGSRDTADRPENEFGAFLARVSALAK